MDEQKKYLSVINNTITGSYEYKSIYYSDDTIKNIKSIVNNLLNEKQDIKDEIIKIEYINSNILRNIYFFDKIYCYERIRHNNTINFVLKNYSQIKGLLDRFNNIYNYNYNTIYILKEKIYTLDLTIDSYNLHITNYTE